jgi:hypothetical protein
VHHGLEPLQIFFSDISQIFVETAGKTDRVVMIQPAVAIKSGIKAHNLVTSRQ